MKSFIFCLITSIILIVTLPTITANNWSNIKIIKERIFLPDGNISLAEAPSIAAWGNNIYIVWGEWANEFENCIYYKRSSDDGRTWTNETILINSNFSTVYPKIGVYKDNVHVIWKDYRNGNPEIYYIRSTDNGNTWSKPIRLTFNDTRPTNIYECKLVVDEKNVYLCWKDYRTGSSEIFFKKSTDNGNTWSEDKRVTIDFSPSYNPSMYVNNKNIYLVWEEGALNARICFKRSIDNGETWSKKIYLTEKHPGKSTMPDICGNTSNIYVVWQDTRDGNSEIYFKKSTDNGNTWSEDKRLTFNPAMSFQPRIVVYGKKLVVFWLDKRNGNTEIYYKVSNDSGTTWSEDKRLTYTKVNNYDLDITYQGENLYLVWQKYYGGEGGEIAYEQFISDNPSIIGIKIPNRKITYFSNTKIKIYGVDNKYNLSDLTCIVEFRNVTTNKWKNISSNFNKTCWEIKFPILNITPGVYQFKAMITNPEGKQSKWIYSPEITLVHLKTRKTTPGFELLITVLASLIILISGRIKK